MFKSLSALILFFAGTICSFSQNSELSVEKIMQDTDWMGTFPSNVHWGVNSNNIYFNYNPEGNPSDSLYRIKIDDPKKILKVSVAEKDQLIPQNGDFNDSRSKKVFTEDGDLYLYEKKSGTKKELLDLPFSVNDPQFLKDENKLAFYAENNAFIFDLEKGSIKQITHIEKGSAKSEDEPKLSDKDEWLQEENLDLLEVVRQRKEKEESSEDYRESIKKDEKFKFYLKDKELRNLVVSPNASYAGFSLIDQKRGKNTEVPNYVDESGYTENISARTKVGDMDYTAELALYNFEKDTVFILDFSELPGISDLPNYTSDYPDKEWKKEPREIIPSEIKFSENGEKAVVNLRSTDNKDRWIALLDLNNGEIKSIERQRDEAWLAGPGIGYTYYGYETLGWLPDNKHIYFQSEDSGYSHLYILNVETGKKKDLTTGNYEVFDPFISNDEKALVFHFFKGSSGRTAFL